MRNPTVVTMLDAVSSSSGYCASCSLAKPCTNAATSSVKTSLDSTKMPSSDDEPVSARERVEILDDLGCPGRPTPRGPSAARGCPRRARRRRRSRWRRRRGSVRPPSARSRASRRSCRGHRGCSRRWRCATGTRASPSADEVSTMSAATTTTMPTASSSAERPQHRHLGQQRAPGTRRRRRRWRRRGRGRGPTHVRCIGWSS